MLYIKHTKKFLSATRISHPPTLKGRDSVCYMFSFPHTPFLSRSWAPYHDPVRLSQYMLSEKKRLCVVDCRYLQSALFFFRHIQCQPFVGSWASRAKVAHSLRSPVQADAPFALNFNVGKRQPITAHSVPSYHPPTPPSKGVRSPRTPRLKSCLFIIRR